MAQPTADEPLVIVGAGLSGSLLALYLAQRGFHVDVYEYRQDWREEGFTGGRSINLALSTRGLNALDGVGLTDKIKETCIPMHGRMMHDTDGELTFQPYGKEGQYINSVSRQLLNEVVMEAADAHPHVNFHFQKRCVELDLDQGSPTFEDLDSGKHQKVSTRYLFGADGAFSSVRQRLQKTDRFDYQQHFLPHGYKELSIPAAEDGGFRIEKNALHIWPRKDFMMIALPNLDGTFTCTLFMGFEDAENSFAALETDDDVMAFFEREFADALPHMPTLLEDWNANPTSSLVTVRCAPYHHSDQVMILGDAAHAIVPFYGQGMNAAFEDCFLIDQLVEKHAPDWGQIGREFSRTRKDDADAIADLALYNFVEMRDKVASPTFLWRKKLEKVLHALAPSWWIPLYTMVTFSNMPYAQAKSRAARQDRYLSIGLILLAIAASIALATILFVFGPFGGCVG